MKKLALLAGCIVFSSVTAVAELDFLLLSEEDRIVAALPEVPAGLNESYQLRSWASKRVTIDYEHTMRTPQLEATETYDLTTAFYPFP